MDELSKIIDLTGLSVRRLKLTDFNEIFLVETEADGVAVYYSQDEMTNDLFVDDEEMVYWDSSVFAIYRIKKGQPMEEIDMQTWADEATQEKRDEEKYKSDNYNGSYR